MRSLRRHLENRREISLHKPTDSSDGIGKAKHRIVPLEMAGAFLVAKRIDRRMRLSPHRTNAVATRGYSGMEKS